MKLTKTKRFGYRITQCDGIDSIVVTLAELIDLKSKIEHILETESRDTMLDSIVPFEL